MEWTHFVLNDADAHAAASGLWTRACGETFALSQRALAYNTRPCVGAQQAGQFAVMNGARIGFVLASVLQNDARAASPEHGWIDALVVAPDPEDTESVSHVSSISARSRTTSTRSKPASGRAWPKPTARAS